MDSERLNDFSWLDKDSETEVNTDASLVDSDSEAERLSCYSFNEAEADTDVTTDW